jgi:hypothetical protein
LLQAPLAALLGSDAHWVFDRGALTGHRPERGQYLTVVSSGVPELMEVRGRELVDRVAAQVTQRLGDADLLWSRVSREPEATIALRPGHRPSARERAACAPPRRRHLVDLVRRATRSVCDRRGVHRAQARRRRRR